MDQHDNAMPNGKVLLLAAAGASVAALLIALGRRGHHDDSQIRTADAAEELKKEAKKAAKAAKKKRKELQQDAEAAGQHLAANLRESAAVVAAKSADAERDLKAAAWDAQQEAREAESRLRAARQRVVEDAGHLASRVGAEARHLAGGGKERLAHLRHRDDVATAAEREVARLRAELEALRAEHGIRGRSKESGMKDRFRRMSGEGGTMQAVAGDAGSAALAQVEKALRAKAPALLTARNRAQVMEILQQDLGPTLRETAMQAAAAAMASWDATRERGAVAEERVREAADEVRHHAGGSATDVSDLAMHLRDEAVSHAEEAARDAHERAEAAAQRVESVRERGKRRFWRSDDEHKHEASAENGFAEPAEAEATETVAEPAAEEHRSKAGLFWGGAGLGLALYALLDAERREKVLHLANETSVQIQELVRDLQGYDDEF